MDFLPQEYLAEKKKVLFGSAEMEQKNLNAARSRRRKNSSAAVYPVGFKNSGNEAKKTPPAYFMLRTGGPDPSWNDNEAGD